jgi:hypothetical protein
MLTEQNNCGVAPQNVTVVAKGANYTVRQTAKRIELLSAVAAVMAYPAAIGFVLLSLIGQHGGLLGFTLIWLLGAGVSIRVYAQFLRLWHGIGYPSAAMEGAVAPPRTVTVRAGPPSAIPEEVTGLRRRDELALTSPGPPSASEVTGLVGLAERSAPLTSSMRAGTVGVREEAEEWREALTQEWANAEAKLGTANPGIKGLGSMGPRSAA